MRLQFFYCFSNEREKGGDKLLLDSFRGFLQTIDISPSYLVMEYPVSEFPVSRPSLPSSEEKLSARGNGSRKR
jgi:hypothetical protein